MKKVNKKSPSAFQSNFSLRLSEFAQKHSSKNCQWCKIRFSSGGGVHWLAVSYLFDGKPIFTAQKCSLSVQSVLKALFNHSPIISYDNKTIFLALCHFTTVTKFPLALNSKLSKGVKLG